MSNNETRADDKYISPSSPLAKGGEFELGLSAAKLENIVGHKTRLLELDPHEAYIKLSEANQRALEHLVKAADILDKVFLKQDHPDNIRVADMLWAEAMKPAASADAALNALTVFIMHNGIEGVDMYAKKSRPLRLFKNKKLQPGKAFYPQDITKKELVNYIVEHPEQASAILGNKTIGRREGDRLVAEPYSVAFRTEMETAARELLLAAKATDHTGLRDYLRLQAQALVNDADPEMMFKADRAWVNLEDSPLEFTIGRESYDDGLSAAVAADPKVAVILEANGIKAKQKDSIGVRVGIVNMESRAQIVEYLDGLDVFAKKLPLYEEYRQQADETCKREMTFVDVDLVALTGDYAAVRGGMTIAQNLPNSDKLSTQLGEGSRLVFHRQNRSGADPALEQQFLDALVDPKQHHLYNIDTSLPNTVGHEAGHSLGPVTSEDGRNKKASLGNWGGIIEENKADLISILRTDDLHCSGKKPPNMRTRST